MDTPYVQANTNGTLHDAATPGLAPLDRGFLYGDAVYEVWRTYGGVVFAFDEHFERLARSAAALALTLPLDRAALVAEIQRTAAAFVAQTGHVGPLYIRLQVTRGGGVIGLDVALADRPSFVLLVQKLRLPPPEKLRAGVELSVARELRRNPRDSLDPAWKTGNYLNNLLCLREARSRGADEVVILNHAGRITEAAVSNLFFVRRNAIVTPPLSAGLLAGITRGLVLERIAPRIGVTALEEDVTPADLRFFDGAFLSSTTRDLAPIARIDDQVFPVDDSALVWKLKAAFENYATEYAAAHPDLRMNGG